MTAMLLVMGRGTAFSLGMLKGFLPLGKIRMPRFNQNVPC
jgi:hypothetical protein